MASTPITFLECRERHEQPLLDALNDLKAAKRYDAAAISPYETQVTRALNGLGELLAALRVVDMPATAYRADVGTFPVERNSLR